MITLLESQAGLQPPVVANGFLRIRPAPIVVKIEHGTRAMTSATGEAGAVVKGGHRRGAEQSAGEMHRHSGGFNFGDLRLTKGMIMNSPIRARTKTNSKASNLSPKYCTETAMVAKEIAKHAQMALWKKERGI